MRDESGNIVKWYGISIDIEDRKRAEEELRAKERDLIRIINTIPTTAWATRPDGYCEFLSDRWLDYAGFTYEEAVGWRWAAAIHPDDAAGLQEHWLGRLATGMPVNTEARMRRYDGVYRWFLFLAQPFRDESGTIVKWYRSVPARSISFLLDAHSLSKPHEEVLDFCGKLGHCVGKGG